MNTISASPCPTLPSILTSHKVSLRMLNGRMTARPWRLVTIAYASVMLRLGYRARPVMTLLSPDLSNPYITIRSVQRKSLLRNVVEGGRPPMTHQLVMWCQHGYYLVMTCQHGI